MILSEHSLRSLIRLILRENVSTYRGGAHAKYFSGGDPAFNIPQIDGVDIDISRANSNGSVAHYSVAINVEKYSDFNVMQIFKDEEEAKKFARDKAEYIKRYLEMIASNE